MFKKYNVKKVSIVKYFCKKLVIVIFIKYVLFIYTHSYVYCVYTKNKFNHIFYIQ